jgi:hypothetical protein
LRILGVLNYQKIIPPPKGTGTLPGEMVMIEKRILKYGGVGLTGY